MTEVARIHAHVHTGDNEVSIPPVTASDYEASPRPRQVQNHLSKAKAGTVVAAYQAGMPVKELAADFGIARQTVTEIYRRAGLEPRKRGLSPAQVLLAAQLYGDGASLAAVGKREASSADADADAMCAAQSFAPTTGVLLASGAVIPIATVTVGQKVLSTDPSTGKTTAEPVERVWIDHDSDLLDLVTQSAGSSSVVHTTRRHPIWDSTKHEWVKAENLSIGDKLRTSDGSFAQVANTASVSGAADMWDLTVGVDHDFYVDEVGVAILVHNCPDPRIGGHIMSEHGPGTEWNGKGTFGTGTSEDDIQSMIDETLRRGTSRAGTRGRGGELFEHTFDSPIGTNGAGDITSSLRVVMGKGGELKTAFPY